MSQTSQSQDYQSDWRRSRCASGSFRPLEIVAMILGFIFFWPVGLAILFFKLWQMKSGHQGDLTSFAQQKADEARNVYRDWRPAQWASHAPAWSAQSGAPRTNSGWNPRTTGNHAFDDWRATELTRLEEERRKLEEAEREFTEHIDELRRARDREEFERFMTARRNRQTPTNPGASHA